MCRCISDGKKHIKTQQLHSSARMALSLQDKDLVQTHLGPQMRGSSLLYKVDTKWEQSTHLCRRTAEAIFYCCIAFFPPLLNVHILQRLTHFTLWIWWEMKREETVGVIGNMGTTYKRQRESWNWDIENRKRSMKRQSGSKEGNIKTKWVQKNDNNKGTAELSLIEEGMRYRDSRGWRGMSWWVRKKNTCYFCEGILLFILFLSSGVSVTWICRIISYQCKIDGQTFTWHLSCLFPLIFTQAPSVNLNLSLPTAQTLHILISHADSNNRFGSCLTMRSVWLSSTERQRDNAESGESLYTVGTGETTRKVLRCSYQLTPRLNRHSKYHLQ